MTTPKKSTKRTAVEDTFSEDESLDLLSSRSVTKNADFDDDEFDLPLDDLDGLDQYDDDDEDDY